MAVLLDYIPGAVVDPIPTAGAPFLKTSGPTLRQVGGGIAVTTANSFADIYDGSNKSYSTSEIRSNCFVVYGENGCFFWLVQGTRGELNVEPLKKDTDVKGDGPYKYIQ